MMQKEDLVQFIRRLKHCENPDNKEAYLFWQIIDLFCRRNGVRRVSESDSGDGSYESYFVTEMSDSSRESDLSDDCDSSDESHRSYTVSAEMPAVQFPDLELEGRAPDTPPDTPVRATNKECDIILEMRSPAGQTHRDRELR
ncbi:serine/threonine-protein kinase PSK2 [Tachysurus ichikawai]